MTLVTFFCKDHPKTNWILIFSRPKKTTRLGVARPMLEERLIWRTI
jgi:hypothetical protein